jgi:hypothetical protein
MALLPLIRQAMLSLCRLLTIPLLASLLTLALLTLLASAPLSASNHIIYVDADSLCNSGCGGSWATAHPYLQDALAAAQSGDEIWVAEGLYYPDEGAGQTANDRASTFQLQNGVAVYGRLRRGRGRAG